MFTSQIYWRVKALVSSLSRQNFEEHRTEMSDLTRTHGENVKIFYLASLLDEADFVNPQTIRDEIKLRVLRDEITHCYSIPNFPSILCQSVEGGNRHSILQMGGKLPDEFLLVLCKSLKLSSAQGVMLGVALAQSSSRALAIDALRLVRMKLPELNSPGTLADLSDELIQGIYRFISKSEELSSPEVSAAFVQSVRSLPSFQNDGSKGKRPDLDEHPAMGRSRASIATALQELGPRCSANQELFTKAISDLGIALDEQHVAEIVVTVLPKNLGVAGSTDTEKWNLDVVADVLNVLSRGLNWALVAQKLDQPNLVMRSEHDFLLLTRFFVRISGIAMPAAGLMRLWSNKTAQLAILILGIKAPRQLLDFSGLVSVDQVWSTEVALPQNLSLACLPLYAILLELASNSLSGDVLEALAAAAGSFPEYILMGLAQVQDPNSGVRAEILRRTLPLFTGLPGSRPTSLIVMKRLQTVNPDLLILLFRIALKRSTTLLDIAEIDSRLRSLGDDVRRRLEEEGNVEELLGYLCVRADKAHFHLEEWIVTVMERNPQLSRAVVAFAKAHAENMRPRTADEGGLLSFESFTILLRALNAHQSLVPIEEMRSFIATVSQHYPSGIPKLLPNAPAPGPAPVVHQLQGQTSVPKEVGELTAEDLARPPESDEVEEEANAYFQKIYTSGISIPDVIQLLKRFKTSEKLREQEIFRCMIHNLFDEYRFFHKYPEKELQVTGRLFGTLIQHQLVSSITLGIALRYVLEALRKDPEQAGSNEKMFRFGKMALDQFRARLSEWPQYCSHLVQIPHFAAQCPEIHMEAQRAISSNTSAQSSADPTANLMNSSKVIATDSSRTLSKQMANMGLEEKAEEVPGIVGSASVDVSRITTSTESGTSRAKQDGSAQESTSAVDGPMSKLPTIIDRMVAVNTNTDLPTTKSPPDNIRDQIFFIINNIARDNMEAKTEELRHVLASDYFSWFANYLVVKRVSTMPNLHPVYLMVLEMLGLNDLFKAILDTTYHNATKLLQSPNITTSSSERSLLRNLGIWLGQITLARNKPLLQRRINLKELLMWGYETARLIAVCSFVAKIIEGVKDSVVFRPPNPWLMAILGVMRELYEIEDLKMNIKFEVQVLCRNINIKIEDIPRGNLLSSCRTPVKDQRNPDFNIKTVTTPAHATPVIGVNSSSALAAASLPTLSPLTQSSSNPLLNYMGAAGSSGVLPIAAASAEEGDDKSLQLEQTVIPNLASFINISASIEYFVANPAQRRIVAIAVDKAIREIIQPVVERSVTISNMTTKQLVLKDFCSEPNEQLLRNGAHLMISNLAGSLALVTCKEPLRIAISNHLRSMLTNSISDQTVLENIVQICSNDNLELGCMLIEKASMEKAVRDVDESIASAIQIRRKHRETGQPFIDVIAAAAKTSVSKYPRELPEQLKPHVGGLLPLQLSVFEAFQRPRVPVPLQMSDGGASASAVGADAKPISAQNLPLLPMSQAIDAYQLVLSRLDVSLRNVQVQAQGREVSISMLGSSHEILTLLREMITITQRTQPTVRAESAMTFCENVFKRLLEPIGVTIDSLRFEVMIGIIEALRDACGGAKKFAPDIVSWLSNYSNFNPNDEGSRNVHRTILLLLLRVKLLRTQDVDSYFATNMDGGKNIAWVELALIFIHQCLSEGLAATYEFTSTFDTVSKMRPANTAVRKQLQKWLTDLRALAASKDEQKATTAPGAQRDASVREHVTVLLERWLRVWTSSNDQVFGQYLHLMHQYGVLKTEDAADRFFRIATELCVEACLKSGQTPVQSTAGQSEATPAPLALTVIDALSKLFLLLVRLADKEAGDITVRVNLLSRILNAIARTLMDDHEAKKVANAVFDQRPYFRLLSNLYQDLGVADSKAEPNQVMVPLLATYCQVYFVLQPSALPGFAFSWLQLISHRCFMPHLLLAKGQKCWPYMHRLLIAVLLFLQPFLKSAQLNESIRRLYKGTLRVLLVLLHDFPEFLCDFHLSFCDAIPSTCVQLRNLILSAFPRSMRLPDPFTPNLKVDLLPEITQSPRILTDYIGVLTERGIRLRLDSYISSKQPPELPTLLPTAVVTPNPNGSGVVTNAPLLTSIVVYVGNQAIVQLQSKIPLQNSPAMDIFKQLVVALDAEGRYHLFNAMANQLRYPNSHTHYFSCVLLVLFADAENEFIQEQITRVLLERLIVHRPHPWGLLITFIELIKNSRYEFWKRGFTRCAPEIERVFESVARSCMGPTAVAPAATGQTVGIVTPAASSMPGSVPFPPAR